MPNIIIAADNGGYSHAYLGIPNPNGVYTFFGKYPENGVPGGDAIIKIDNARYEDMLDGNRSGFSESVSITDQQLNGLVNYLVSSVENPGTFLVVGKNCADWVNGALVSSGIAQHGLTDLIQQGVITTSDLDAADSGHSLGVGDYIKWIYNNGSDASNWLQGADTGYLSSNPDYTVITGSGGGQTLALDNGHSIVLGTGSEIISYANASSGMDIDLSLGTTYSGSDIKDMFFSVSGAIGSAYADTIIGNSSDNSIDGGLGNDSIDGGDGINTLAGGDGNDRLVASTGNNMMHGGDGRDTLDGGAGSNTYTGGAGSDLFVVSPGAHDIIMDLESNNSDERVLFEGYSMITTTFACIERRVI